MADPTAANGPGWDEWHAGVEGDLEDDVVVEEGAGPADLPQPAGIGSCTETWDTSALNDVPDARSSHTAIRTGSEVIIRGGFRNGGLRPCTGARSDPAAVAPRFRSCGDSTVTSIPARLEPHRAGTLTWGLRRPGPEEPISRDGAGSLSLFDARA